MCFRCVDVAVQSGEFADSKVIESVLLEPIRLRAKDLFRQNDAVVEAIVFPGYFSICVISVIGLPALFHLFQWLLARGTQGAMLRNQKSDLPTLVVVSLGGHPSGEFPSRSI